MATQWTTEQAQCIHADGGTLLVSAAAGSGKTTVLVQRIIERVTRADNPVDIDRLLIVTFTRAAAAEMKQRLTAALADALARDPHNARLQHQQILLPHSHISTIDGFCTTLVREHFHTLDISPNFKIGDEGELHLLREEALTQTVEALYEEDEAGFRTLAALLGSARGDQALYRTIERVHTCIGAHPFPTHWLRDSQRVYTQLLPIEQTPWGAQALRRLHAQIAMCCQLAQAAVDAASVDEQLMNAYLPTINDAAQRLTALCDTLPTLSWDDQREAVASFSFGTLKAIRKCTDEAAKLRAKSLWDTLKSTFKSLTDVLCCSAMEFADDRAALAPAVTALCRAVEQFSDAYTAKKRQRDLLDFSDVQHLALSLLVTRQEDGTVVRTPLAREIGAQFDEVMVDEYQDTNAAQDTLFAALSRDEQNLFLVGDVKQSIYGFRQAMPDLFIHRRDRYPLFDGEHHPATIVLGHNFRSRVSVTDAVNTVFRQIMTRETGGIDYDKSEELVPSATHYAEKDGFDTELLVVSGQTIADEDTRDVAEARLIAQRIRTMRDTLTVTDKTGERPAAYRDFCILLRSTTAHAPLYAAELERLGIPVFTEKKGGFLDAPEILLAVSILRVLNNPLQEIPLLAVLHSPLVDCTPDDLASIRQAAPKSPLWAALRLRAKQTDSLGLRCAQFEEFCRRMRVLAATLPAWQLIARVYEDTGLLLREGARKNGNQKVANLRLLQEYAARFDQNGLRGLSAFIRYIDRLMERDTALPPAATTQGDADVVRIMSIHHSKGLEFPFVFVAGLGTKFNEESLKGKVLMHSSMGFGLMRRHSDTLLEHTTLPLEGVKQAIRHSERTEELRVLYVAMTRAKEKLILVTTVDNPAKKLAELAALVGNAPTLPTYLVMNAANMGEWILAAMLRHPSGGVLRQCADWYDPPAPVEADCPWHIDIVRAPEADLTADTARPPMPPPDTAAAQVLTERFLYRYPYTALCDIPVKLAASELSHRHADERYITASRPATLSRGGLTPAERGTATHTFMQFARYAQAQTDLEAEIARLVSAAFLTQAQADALPRAALTAFFGSDLYRRMAATRCLREYPFTVSMRVDEWDTAHAHDIPADAADETIVIQGIADCLFEENGVWYIVDYKTDRVNTAAELIDRYRAQLRTYAYALTKTLGSTVGGCYLYSFALAQTIPVPL